MSRSPLGHLAVIAGIGFGVWFCTVALGAKSPQTRRGTATKKGACLLVTNAPLAYGNVPVKAERFVTGLEVPWGIAFLDPSTLLITERPGRLRLVEHGKLRPAPVLTLKTSKHTAEGGLLGIALHPDFKTNHLFYLYYTADVGGRPVNRVVRYHLAPDAHSARFDRVILDNIPAAEFHDGGRLHFGADGMLYVATGDARNPQNAQNLHTPAGKILRLTPEGKIPADNPFAGSPVYVLGIRNDQAFAWDQHGKLLIADNGPTGELGRYGHDEVSVAGPGANLGWPTIYSCETHQNMVTPAITWEKAHPPGGASFYTGAAIPGWQGSLLVGILGAKELHRLVLDTQATPVRVTTSETYFAGDPPGGFGRIRDVVQGPEGAVYLTTSNCDGRGTCPATKDWIVRLR